MALTKKQKERIDKILGKTAPTNDVGGRLSRLRAIAGRDEGMPAGYRPEGVVQYERPIGPEPAPVSARERLRDVSAGDVFGRTVRGLGGGMIGGLKQIGETVLGAAALPQQAGRIAAERFMGRPAPEEFKTVREMVDKSKLLERRTPAERGGAMATGIAEYMLPGRMGGKLGMRMIKEAGALAAITAAQEGRIGKEAGVSGALGLFLPVVNKVFGTAGTKIAKDLPERLINSMVSQSKKEIVAGKSVADYVIKKKKIGSANKLIKDTQSAIEGLDIKVKSILKGSKENINRNDIVKLITKKINESGGDISNKEVMSVIKKLAPQARGLLNKRVWTLEEANKLRSSIDKTLGDRGFLVSQLPFNKEVLKSFTNGLRETVKTKAPSSRKLFYDMSNEIRLRNALVGKYTAKQRNQIVTFGDLFGAGIGGAGLGLPGAVAGIAGRRIIQSPEFLSRAGVGLGQLQKLEPVLKKLSGAERGIIYEIFKQLSSFK